MHSINNYNLRFRADGSGKHIYFQVLTYNGQKTIIRCNPDTSSAKCVDRLPEGIPEVTPPPPIIQNKPAEPAKKKDCGCGKKKVKTVEPPKEKAKTLEVPKEKSETIELPKEKHSKWVEGLLGGGSVGLGDTVKYWIETVSFGLIKQKKGCGCERRQHFLNKKFPYAVQIGK